MTTLTDYVNDYRNTLARQAAEDEREKQERAAKQTEWVRQNCDALGLEPTRIDGNNVYLDYEGQEIHLVFISWRYSENGGFFRNMGKCPECDYDLLTAQSELTPLNLGQALCDPQMAYHEHDDESYSRSQKIAAVSVKSAREKLLDALDEYLNERGG